MPAWSNFFFRSFTLVPGVTAAARAADVLVAIGRSTGAEADRSPARWDREADEVAGGFGAAPLRLERRELWNPAAAAMRVRFGVAVETVPADETGS